CTLFLNWVQGWRVLCTQSRAGSLPPWNGDSCGSEPARD
ncbi:hypothetical protein, partial [Pseudomonas sp. FG-3G]